MANIFSNWGMLRDDWVQIEPRVEPDQEAQRTYKTLYPVSRDLYRDTRRWLGDLMG